MRGQTLLWRLRHCLYAVPHWLRTRWLRAIGYPDALIKACYDEFGYAAGVVGLGTVRFQSATPQGLSWVHLDLLYTDAPAVDPPVQEFCFARGVDVRLRDIAWVADAPMDS